MKSDYALAYNPSSNSITGVLFKFSAFETLVFCKAGKHETSLKMFTVSQTGLSYLD
jgi:hypothetical protein